MGEAGNWCLIESDPGVFTELIRGFGVVGVQVEELYSLDKEQFADLKLAFLVLYIHQVLNMCFRNFSLKPFGEFSSLIPVKF